MMSLCADCIEQPLRQGYALPPLLTRGSRKTVFLQNRLKKGREANNIKGFGVIFHAEFLLVK